ncbi:hypothetical protein LG299_04995 [Microbacterium lacus]|uniref:hypothetical protein n=1 Tax=Microbacterium lacus TaxID=415217 RepID=UPI00384B8767
MSDYTSARSTRRPRRRVTLIAVTVAILSAILIGAATIAWAVSRTTDSDRAPGGQASESAPADDSDGQFACPDASVEITTADELEKALQDAEPGDVLNLAPGRYVGEFVTTQSGRQGDPITLCGTGESVLDGGGIKGGYVLHLDGATHWVLQGFSVENGQKGVMADGTTGTTIQGLAVSQIGDEAIHLRAGSSDNQVIDNTISDTGLRKPKFGEGIYIGTAESNWCDISNCKPDESDRNLVAGNDISGTTSESVDIKEGTTGGILRDNTFDGSTITGADSWVDVKGNDWLIEGNTGTNSPEDGFQTHEIVDGWGTRNVFQNNTADLGTKGLGFSLKPERDNVLMCDNTVSGSGAELSNVECVE